MKPDHKSLNYIAEEPKDCLSSAFSSKSTMLKLVIMEESGDAIATP